MATVAIREGAGNRILVYRAVWIGLIWTVGLFPIATGLSSTQFFQADYATVIDPGSHASLVASLIRLATVIIGGLAICAALTALELPIIRSGAWMLAAVLALSLGPVVSMVKGTEPSIQPGLLRLPIIALAVYLLPAADLEWFAGQARRVITVYVWATIAALVFQPWRVLERGYTVGIVPDVEVRLHGIGGHANNFAALLLTWLILGWVSHSTSWLTRVNWAVVLGCLVLTQSKTVWIATIVTYLIRFAYPRGIQRYLSLTGFALLLTVIALAMSFLFPSTLEEATATVSGAQGGSGFSGRRAVWSYTVDLWRQNPMFGYGPNLWDARMALRFAALRGWAPPHAHSQIFQTMGESGLIGMAGLVIFALALVIFAARTAGTSRGITVALAVALAIRSFSEPPLRASIGENLFVLFVTLAAITVAMRRNEAPAHPDRSPGTTFSGPAGT